MLSLDLTLFQTLNAGPETPAMVLWLARAGSAGDFRKAPGAFFRTCITAWPDSSLDDLVSCSRVAYVGAFSKTCGTRTRYSMGSPGPSPRFPQHAHGNGLCNGGRPLLCWSAPCCLGRAQLCCPHCLEPPMPGFALSFGRAGRGIDRIGLHGNCRTIFASPTQMARQIFSILVPPGAPMGSPQVMA